jgi:hypothetical protein
MSKQISKEDVQHILTQKIIRLKKELRRCIAVGGDVLHQCPMCCLPATEHLVSIDGKIRIIYLVERHTDTCTLQEALKL